MSILFNGFREYSVYSCPYSLRCINWDIVFGEKVFESLGIDNEEYLGEYICIGAGYKNESFVEKVFESLGIDNEEYLASWILKFKNSWFYRIINNDADKSDKKGISLDEIKERKTLTSFKYFIKGKHHSAKEFFRKKIAAKVSHNLWENAWNSLKCFVMGCCKNEQYRYVNKKYDKKIGWYYLWEYGKCKLRLLLSVFDIYIEVDAT